HLADELLVRSRMSRLAFQEPQDLFVSDQWPGLSDDKRVTLSTTQVALWPKRITVRLVHIKTRLPLCAKGFRQYKNCPAKRTIYLFVQMAWMPGNALGTSLATGHRENTAASCESPSEQRSKNFGWQRAA